MKLESDQQIEQDERKNPVKRAQREKQFRTVGKLKEIFTEAKEMHQNIMKYSMSIKTVKNQHPQHKQLSIIDYSLAARGPQEDEVYSEQPFFRNNIRRGNTVIVNQKEKQVYWGRRGLIKFFDISDKSLWAIVNQNVKSLNKKDSSIYYSIFSQIQNVLSCNDELPLQHQAKCHVFRLNKANGQNAQVSYFKQTGEWMVSSKNVSIFVKEPADIKLYQGDRYGFSILIANSWFQMLKGRSKEQLEELKNDLSGRTLVGQYCGNPDFQHLVKYEEITIYFYALVEMNSKYSCLPPFETFRILQRHKLPIVKNYQNSLYGKYTTFKELGQNMITLFNTVATSSIFEDEEGSVVYFVMEKPREFCQFVSDRYLQDNVPIPVDWKGKEVWWNVASLGKLKTLEYRILRKLREKLKFFVRSKKKEDNKQANLNDQKKMEQKYGSFQREVYSLVKNRVQQLSKPIKYFFCAAIIAFEYAFKQRKSQRNLTLMSEHYLDFLSVIFWSMEMKKEVTYQMMEDDVLITKLRGSNWDKYGLEIVDHYPELLQKLAPRYAKIKKSLNEQDFEKGEQKQQQGEV